MFKMRILPALLTAAVVIMTACSVSDEHAFYSNPVIQADMPDPCVIRWNDVFYAVGTSSEWAPFYPVYASDDLVNWEHKSYVFDEKPSWTVSSFWAPEFYCMNDKVYCYYTARRASDNVSYIGVAVSDRPDGEYADKGPVIEYGTEAIDAFVFNDDGTLYVSWKAYGLDPRPIEIVGARLSEDGLSLDGEPFTLLVDDEKIGIEGQCHVKIGDWYYLIYAGKGCCGPGSDYDVRVARAREFCGPYERCPRNPILSGGDGDFLSCGHGTLVTLDDGRMYYMCHAYSKGAGFFMGRQPVLHEMVVSEDGWLEFKCGNTAQPQLPMPFSGVEKRALQPVEDEFDDGEIALEWTWNYPYADIHAQEVGGSLMLASTSKGSNKYGGAFCLRPRTPYYECLTVMESTTMNMAGLTFYGDDANLLVWGVRNQRLQLMMVRNGKEDVLYDSEIPASPLWLKADVEEGCKASLSWSLEGSAWETVTSDALDISSLVRWDRVFRPGMITDSPQGNPARFEKFILRDKNL